MWVVNMHVAADKSCRCGNWLEHWARFGGYTTLAVCSANNCCKIATVGAHIQVNGDELIVPMCDRHHQQKFPVDVFENTLAVSADLTKTCARPSLADLGLTAFAGRPPHRFQSPADVAGALAARYDRNTTLKPEQEEVARFLNPTADKSLRNRGN